MADDDNNVPTSYTSTKDFNNTGVQVLGTLFLSVALAATFAITREHKARFALTRRQHLGSLILQVHTIDMFLASESLDTA